MAEQENISVRLEADTSRYTSGLRDASRQTTAFGQAGTKAGRAVAAANKEVEAAAKAAAKAEEALATATAAGARAADAQAAAQTKLTVAQARHASALQSVTAAEARLTRARESGKQESIDRAEATLARRRAATEVSARGLARAEAAATAARGAGVAVTQRAAMAEAAVAAAVARSAAATVAAAQASTALGASRLAGVRTLGRDFATMATQSEELRSSFSGVALVAGGALAAGLGYAAYAGVQLEQRLMNVGTISETVRNNMGDYTAQILDLSRVVPQSANELAEGLYDIASSGFDGAEAMTVLTASAQAASAGLSTTATSAKAITGVLNAYGLSAASATDISDIMFETVNKGVITFEELAQQVGDFVGVASAANVSFDDAAAGLAAITLSGIPAAQAATALQNTMNKMLKPSESMAQALRELGYNSGASALRTLGLKGTIDALAKSQGTAADTAMRLFPDIEAARGYLALTAAEGRNYARTFDAIADEVARAGAAHDALKVQQESAAFRMEIAKNSVVALATELGTSLLPAIKLATALVQGFSEFMEDIPGPIRVVVGVLAGLSGAVLISGAAFLRAKPSIDAFRQSLQQARDQGSALPGVMRGASVALGAVGVAVAAATIGYAFYAAEKAKAKAATEEFVRALESEASGVENAVQNSAIKTLVDEGDIETMKRYGVDVGKVIHGLSGTTEEYDAAVAHMLERANDPSWMAMRDQWHGALWDSDIQSAVGHVQDLRTAFDAAKQATAESKKAQIESARQAAKNGNAHDLLTATLHRNQQGNIELDESQKQLVKSMQSFVDVSAAAAQTFKAPDYSTFDDLAKKGGKSLSSFTKVLQKSGRDTENWREDLAKAAEKVGPEMAEQLEKLGPKSAGLVAKIARANAPEIKKIKSAFASLAPSAEQSFKEFTNVLEEQITAQRDYLTNLAKITGRGYSDVADAISQIADPAQAAAAAKAAVDATLPELDRFREVYGKRLVDPELAATFKDQFRVLGQIVATDGRVALEDVADMFALPRDQLDLTVGQLVLLRDRINDLPTKTAIDLLIQNKGLTPEQVADLRRHLKAGLPPVEIDATDAKKTADQLLARLEEIGATKANPLIELPSGKTVAGEVAEILAELQRLSEFKANPQVAMPGANSVQEKAEILQKRIQDLNASSASIPVDAPGAADTAKALGNVTLKIRDVNGKDVEVKVNASTSGMPEAEGWFSKIKGIFSANGNILEAFANGSENHVAQIAAPGAWRVWAEPETGGEAYIPLSPTKRDRSEAILADVADRFGYTLEQYAEGGINALAPIRASTRSPGAAATAGRTEDFDRSLNETANAIGPGWNRLVGRGMNRILGGFAAGGGPWVNPMGGGYNVSADWMSYPGHTGIDMAGPIGTPIRAASAGRVMYGRRMGTSYGNHVRVAHAGGIQTLYAHMNDYIVAPGQMLAPGQVLGFRGSTGNSTGPHLHFETRQGGGTPVNPRPFMAARGVRLANGGIRGGFKGRGGPSPQVLTDPAGSLELGMRPRKKGDPVFDWSLYRRNLSGSVRETEAWHRNLAKVTSRAGADVAEILEGMGEEGVALTRKMATGTKREVDAIASQLRRLAPEASASLTRFNAALGQETAKTAAFEKNLTTLAARGYGALAKALAEAGDAAAMKQARDAVKSNKAASSANSTVKKRDALLGEDLEDLLTVIDAIRSSKSGIHRVADITGLAEDRIIEVANRGASQIKAMGGSATKFRGDLGRANKQLSYAEGGMHVAQIANTTRIWAEPETGGEAYIPLAATKRARSTRILGDVAKQFGYGLLPMADGGVVRGRTVDAASGGTRVVVVERPTGSGDAPLIGSLTIPLVGTQATPRQAGEEMLYQIRRARRGGRR